MQNAQKKAVITAFVRLVLAYDWRNKGQITLQDKQVIEETLMIAGFKINTVTLGQAKTFEGVTVNKTFPYKVVGHGSVDHIQATWWLDMISRSILSKLESTENLEKFVLEEIQESVPLEPIRLTHEGDYLLEYFLECVPEKIEHKRDKDTLPRSNTGIHHGCRGVFRTNPQTTGNVLTCRSCELMIVLEEGVKTYGDLRRRIS